MAWLSTTATVSMKPATLDDNVVTSPPMYASSVDSINRPLVHQYQPNQTAALKHAAQAADKRISFHDDPGDRLAVSPGMYTIRVVRSIFGLALASPSHIDHSTVFQLGESQRQLRSMKGNFSFAPKNDPALTGRVLHRRISIRTLLTLPAPVPVRCRWWLRWRHTGTLFGFFLSECEAAHF